MAWRRLDGRVTDFNWSNRAKSFVIDLAPLKRNNRDVDREKIIFFRNFFFAAFIIGLIFVLFYFAATLVF